jgi:hypothetical protein
VKDANCQVWLHCLGQLDLPENVQRLFVGQEVKPAKQGGAGGELVPENMKK